VTSASDEKTRTLQGVWKQKARTGFEPVLREEDDEPPLGREPDARPASELPADLQRIVERLTRKRGARESRD
jgi:hypothetical protein